MVYYKRHKFAFTDFHVYLDVGQELVMEQWELEKQMPCHNQLTWACGLPCLSLTRTAAPFSMIEEIVPLLH